LVAWPVAAALRLPSATSGWPSRVALVAGIGNLTLTVFGVELEGIAWGSAGIIVLYPVLQWLYRTVGEGQGS